MNPPQPFEFSISRIGKCFSLVLTPGGTLPFLSPGLHSFLQNKGYLGTCSLEEGEALCNHLNVLLRRGKIYKKDGVLEIDELRRDN